MNFFETQAGYDFFGTHLPRMIAALEKIANALSHPPSVPVSDTVPYEEFLSDLYYGNYEPEKYQSRHQLKIYNRQVTEADSMLCRHLDSEGRRLFNEYLKTTEIRNNAEAEQAYISGFRTAVQMLLAGIIPSQASADIKKGGL